MEALAEASSQAPRDNRVQISSQNPHLIRLYQDYINTTRFNNPYLPEQNNMPQETPRPIEPTEPIDFHPEVPTPGEQMPHVIDGFWTIGGATPSTGFTASYSAGCSTIDSNYSQEMSRIYKINPETHVDLSEFNMMPMEIEHFDPPMKYKVFRTDPKIACMEGDQYYDAETGCLTIYKTKEYDKLMTKRKYIPKEITCNRCSTDVLTRRTQKTAENGLVCITCLSENYEICRGCKGLYDMDRLMQDRERSYYCKACAIKLTSQCPECGQHVQNEHMLNNRTLCTWCVEDGRDSDSTNYRKNKAYRGSTKGEIIKSIRPFGVEIETQYRDSDNYRMAVGNLPDGMNVGTDGSINGNGIELRTPIMSGKKGENCIKNICEVLNGHEFKVDKSCGLHIHVDAADIDMSGKDDAFPKLKTIFLFYLTFEDVILSFLPKSRRNNKYCLPLRTSYNLKEIMSASTLSDLEKIWYRVSNKKGLASEKNERKHGSRYHGINMHTLLAFRHIEIRFHSGTINANKINEWINLHTAIMDKCTKDMVNWSNLEKAIHCIDIAEKTQMFFKYLPLTTDSIDYFLTRQEIFAKEEKVSINAKIRKQTEEVLSAEQES